MDVEDCYSELGLRADCTDAELKSAWRRLAARWHPDRNASPDAPEMIQRINRALERIRSARQGAGAPPSPAAQTPATVVERTVSISLEEALAGCSRELQGDLAEDCGACAGSGEAAEPSACPACSGTGQVQQPIWFTWMAAPARCGACAGQGSTRTACPGCDGSGQAPRRSWRCRVRIAPGARAGDELLAPARMQGAGGAQRVSVRVRIALAPHELFEVDAQGQVRCAVPVDGWAWMAERWVEVPTPAGLQQMKLRRGHLVYRIRASEPASGAAGPRADCIVTVVPLFPEEPSAAQEALLDRLIASHSGSADTPAGQHVAAWRARLQQWQDRLARKP